MSKVKGQKQARNQGVMVVGRGREVRSPKESQFFKRV